MSTRIVEGQLPYSGGTGIGIDTNKVISILLREEDNLIQVNGDNEIYTDLQLVANIKPTDDFPVGVTTGKILQSDGWSQSGLLLNWKTTSGDYARWIYANDGKIYFDNGTGTWEQVYYSSEVDNLIQTLRNYVDTFQPKLTAGTGIVIDQNNVISTTGGQGTGDVVGPNSSTDGNLAVFDGITGKVLKDGGPIPAPTTVVDALDSTSTTSALSANQGRILDGKIADMMGLGKFLSLWNSTTGQPISFPLATPYAYTTGDYFIIEVVSSATPPVNYRPDGSSYTGTASSVAETDEIEIGDVYVYDGQTWLLQSNHGKTVAFANIAGQPSDNTALANALNSKQNTLTAGTNIDITNNVISAEGLTILSYGNSTWNDFITAYNRGGLVYCRASSNSNPASGTQGRMAFMAYLDNPTTPTEVEFQYYRSVSTKSASQQGDQVFVYKLTNANGGTWTVTTREASTKITAGTNMSESYSNGTLTLSATDTKYTAGTGLALNGTEFSNSGVTSVNNQTGAVTVAGVPSGGTNGDVLTNVSGTPTWQAPTGGGDVLVSTQANNIFSSGMKIWGGTQANYESLTPDSNTAYLIVASQPTPPSPGRQPGVNTVLYMPLKGDIIDQTGNYTFTNTNVTVGSNYATFNGDGVLLSTSNFSLTGTSARTLSIWINPSSTSNLMVLAGWGGSNQGSKFGFYIDGSGTITVRGNGGSYDVYTNEYINYNTWNLLTATYDGTNILVYQDGTLIYSDTKTFNTGNGAFSIGAGSDGSFDFEGNIGAVVVEDKARTAQEASDYFNSTKGDYGIS